MSKSKMQLYQDYEYVQPQANVNLINTHKCIKAKKIRKFKVPQISKNNQMTPNGQLICSQETTTNYSSKPSQYRRETIFSKNKEKYHCFHGFYNVNLGALQQNANKELLDVESHFVEMQNSSHKQIFLPLPPIKEVEDNKSKLKEVKINEQLYSQDNLELILLKIDKQHKIKIEYYIQISQTKPN
ncbi:unnamed protein product (macronuclear) [Paramecium tetraurelia]|uniref:Uncharacterized protein n=1 Tax=Paramecium tetraurelia TaxID=5888 RepID=A0BJ54_PARTE|nr:uncharacterized protein GSPATT00004944001 [Paramecium tetraurelia]CAK58571.1 unnamed protein product [Paramecium tetraurelia]|eukprot:XP_001425969.1 hypothetical protein (macronuclear) [Paramecium tetraurelia strain d4-2]